MGRCMVCKVRKYRTLLLTKKQTVCCKFKRFQVKLQIQPSNFHYRSRNSVVWSPHIFMYNSPSNIYLVIHTFSLCSLYHLTSAVAVFMFCVSCFLLIMVTILTHVQLSFRGRTSYGYSNKTAYSGKHKHGDT